MTEKQFFWYMLCNWSLVVATIVLSIVAIWGHMLRARWFGPRLRLRLHDRRGEVSKFSDGAMARFYHLLVWNERRAAPAHNVRVVVTAVFRPSADGAMTPTALSGPVQLQWQFQPSKPQFQTIGAESVCDLGYIRQGEEFTLALPSHPISLDPTLKAGHRMLVVVAALADECESNELRLEISSDGKWCEDADEMSKNLVVKDVTQASTRKK